MQKLIDIKTASELLGIKLSRMRVAVFKGEVPYIKIGRLIRFNPIELETWIEAKSQKPASTKGGRS